MPFALRGIVAHFVASSLGSAFVLFGVCAIQGVLLATIGPRIFARVSPIVQLLLAVIVLEHPRASVIGGSAIRSLEADGVAPLVVHLHGRTSRCTRPRLRRRRAIVGAEDAAHLVPRRLRVILGTTEPRFHELARTGVMSVVAVFGIVLITYPRVRRMAVAAVEHVDPGMGRRA